MTAKEKMTAVSPNLTNEQVEAKLLDVIRNNKNPEQALLVAIGIISDYLKRCEATE